MSITYPMRRPDLKTKLLPDGHAVIFHEETLLAHVLNPLGSIIWEFCDGLRSRDEILSELKILAGSEVPSDTEIKAVEFLTELEQNGLLIEGTNAAT